jgi:hypothetical protein
MASRTHLIDWKGTNKLRYRVNVALEHPPRAKARNRRLEALVACWEEAKVEAGTQRSHSDSGQYNLT